MSDTHVSPRESSPAPAPVTPRFRGVIPPVVTPFRPSGEIDHGALAALVEHLIGAGVDGVFALGSSGEAAYLSDTHREAVLTTVVGTVGGRVPVLVGCLEATAPRVSDQARIAARVGADALVATAPFYAMNDEAEIADHFRRIRSAVELPLFAYDIPLRVRVKLGAEMLVGLGREGVLTGVKDSSGDEAGFRMLVLANREAGSPLSVFTGQEVVCDAALMVGADGLVPGLANVDAEGYVRLWRAAGQQDWQAARSEQERLADLMRIARVAGHRSVDARGIGAFKAAMAHLGLLPSATMADPVQQLTEDEAAGVRAIVDRSRRPDVTP